MVLLAVQACGGAPTPTAAPVINGPSDTGIKSCSNPTASVKIGSEFELSGAVVDAGSWAAQGVDLAVKEITGKGGFDVAGTCYKIDLVKKDVRSDPATATAVTRGLVKDDGVKFILGPVSGGDFSKAYAVTQAENPKLIHFAVSTIVEFNGVMGKPDTQGIFRALAPGAISGDAFMEALKKFTPQAKTIYFLWPDDQAAKFLVDNTMMKKAKDLGYSIVGNDRYPFTATDFSSYLQRAKAANPNILAIGWNGPSLVAITKQASELGIKSTLAAWNGTVSIPLKDASGSPIDIPFVNLGLAPDLQNPHTPAVKSFVDRLKTSSGKAIDGNSFWAAEFYDPTYMLVRAMQLAGTTTNPDAVSAAMLKLRWSGPMGPYCWNSDHTAIIPNELAYVKGGQVSWSAYTPPTSLCVPAS
jgi:ABC-type branched-subunit amino acid transport system substrate-binding protein